MLKRKKRHREGAHKERRHGGASLLSGDYQRLSALMLVDCWMGQRRRGDGDVGVEAKCPTIMSERC